MPLFFEHRLEAIKYHWHNKLQPIYPVKLGCQQVDFFLKTLHLLSDLQLLEIHATLQIKHILVAL